MSNFWEMSDGKSATETGVSFEIEGNMEPIPNNTGCIGVIEEVKWSMYETDNYINQKWRILRPEAYANRVVFQKIYPLGKAGKDEAYSDRQKRMFAAIDANAGGKLSKLESIPTDEDLMSALAGKMMAIKVMKWTISAKDSSNGEERSGNWISAVAPAKGGAKPAAQVQAKKAAAPVVPPHSDSFEDDIPFN
jgi:hypothetical protein